MSDTNSFDALRDQDWLMFTGVTDVEARQIFEKRYGEKPEQVVVWNGWVYVGPVRDEIRDRSG